VIEAFDGLSLVERRAFSLGPASPAEPFDFERAAGITSVTSGAPLATTVRSKGAARRFA
jgi:hypothetical protein